MEIIITDGEKEKFKKIGLGETFIVLDGVVDIKNTTFIDGALIVNTTEEGKENNITVSVLDGGNGKQGISEGSYTIKNGYIDLTHTTECLQNNIRTVIIKTNPEILREGGRASFTCDRNG